MSVLIKGGTVVTAEQMFRADVLTDGGKIVGVGEKLDVPAGAQVVDAGSQYVMPGGIDPHTHMQLPFMGTVASPRISSTGTTAGCTRRRYDDDHRLRHPRSAAEHLADDRLQTSGANGRRRPVSRLFSFHVAITWWRRIRSMPIWPRLVRDHGVNSVQALHGLQERDHGAEDENAGEQLLPVRANWAPSATVHAENGELVFHLQNELIEQGRDGARRAIRCRARRRSRAKPPTARFAIARGARHVPLYVVHTSCIDALEAITRARNEGQRVYRRGAGRASDDRRFSVYRHPGFRELRRGAMS